MTTLEGLERHREWCVQWFESADGVAALDEAIGLLRAKAEGRLVELPCKLGDTVWVVDRAGIPQEMVLEPPDIRCICKEEDNLCAQLCSRKQHGLCAYRLKNDGSDIGHRVFLSRAEAEAALREVGV